PRIIPLNSRVEADGVGVFDGYNNQLVGKLDKDETKGLNLITRQNKGGTINFEINNHLMVYSIDQTKKSIEIDASDQNNIEIAIHIDAEGNILEMFGSKSLLNEIYMDEMEEQINKRIEELATKTIEKAQNDLKVEFFGFASIL